MPPDVTILCVVCVIVAGICFTGVGYLLGVAAASSPSPDKKLLNWAQSNISELWQKVDDLQRLESDVGELWQKFDELRDDDDANRWKRGERPSWNPDDTEIEGE